MKNTIEKHYLAELEEQHGEYEHTTKFIFKTDGNPLKYADHIAKTWYGYDDAEPADGGGYWQGGEIISKVGEVKKVSFEDFKVLKKYLSAL